jgi:glycerol-3-phosphate acyltransferase PlsX
LKRELTATPVRKLGAMMAKGGFKKLKAKMDPEAHGGAEIIGLNGTVVKVHGSAGERIVANAIRQIAEAESHHLPERIQQEIARATTTIPIPA